MKTTQDAIRDIDNILDKGENAAYDLKKLFGLEVLNDDDFVSALRTPICELDTW